MVEHLWNLARFLQPCDPERFVHQYWGQQPLVLTRHLPQYYAELFSLRDVETVLHSHPLRATDVQVIPQAPEAAPWDAGGPDVTALLRAYAQGGRLFIRNLHTAWPPLAALCRGLEQELTHPVSVDLYLSHPQAPSFHPHYHTYDDFILQIAGCERWCTYDFTPQPARHPSDSPLDPAELPPPAQEVDLQPGDLLYVPRGCVHQARPPSNAALHLVLSVRAFTWADLLRSALTVLSAQDAVYRAPLPLGFLRADAGQAPWQPQCAALVERLASDSTASAAVEQLAQHFIGGMQPLPDGSIQHLDHLERLTLDTVVALRPGMLCRISRTDDSVRIQFPGNTVQGPLAIEPALRCLVEAGTFAVGALPDTLTAASKLVLARRLIRDGLLTILPAD